MQSVRVVLVVLGSRPWGLQKPSSAVTAVSSEANWDFGDPPAGAAPEGRVHNRSTWFRKVEHH